MQNHCELLDAFSSDLVLEPNRVEEKEEETGGEGGGE